MKRVFDIVNSDKGQATILIIVIVVLVYIALHRTYLEWTGITTIATIEEVHYSFLSEFSDYESEGILSFTDSIGIQHRYSYSLHFGPSYRKGQEIEIIYSKSNPKNFIIKKLPLRYGISYLLCFFCLPAYGLYRMATDKKEK